MLVHKKVQLKPLKLLKNNAPAKSYIRLVIKSFSIITLSLQPLHVHFQTAPSLSVRAVHKSALNGEIFSVFRLRASHREDIQGARIKIKLLYSSKIWLFAHKKKVFLFPVVLKFKMTILFTWKKFLKIS